MHSEPETMRFVRHGRPETRAETIALIDIYRREQASRGWTKWSLASRDGRLVGRAGFGEHGNGRELGYTIRRELWGRGLATEVAAAPVQWHLDATPAAPLTAYAAIKNPASCRVLEKTGFARVGTSEHSGMPCYLYRWLDSARRPRAASSGDDAGRAGVVRGAVTPGE